MPSRVFDTASGSRHVFDNLTARPGITFLLVFAALFPGLVCIGNSLCEAPTVPYQDDYIAILAFAADYLNYPA